MDRATDALADVLALLALPFLIVGTGIAWLVLDRPWNRGWGQGEWTVFAAGACSTVVVGLVAWFLR